MTYVVVVKLTIAPEHRREFMPLMLANAAASLADEPGCRQFDVCVSSDDGDSLLLYEVYDNAGAFQAHLGSPHFRTFDQKSASMLLQKRVRTYQLTETPAVAI